MAGFSPCRKHSAVNVMIISRAPHSKIFRHICGKRATAIFLTAPTASYLTSAELSTSRIDNFDRISADVSLSSAVTLCEFIEYTVDNNRQALSRLFSSKLVMSDKMDLASPCKCSPRLLLVDVDGFSLKLRRDFFDLPIVIYVCFQLTIRKGAGLCFGLCHVRKKCIKKATIST